jgi:FK506-binding protein 2
MHLPLSSLFLALLATLVLATDLRIEVTNPVQCTRKTRAGDTITVNYRGTLETGEEFDSSYNRQPFQFSLGSGKVIKGYVFLLWATRVLWRPSVHALWSRALP